MKSLNLLFIVVVVLMSSCNNKEVTSVHNLRKLKAELKTVNTVSNYNKLNTEEKAYFDRKFSNKYIRNINKLNDKDFSKFLELIHVQIDLKKELEQLADDTNERAKKLGIKIRCEVVK